jgi:hypothetical protein
MMFVIQARIMKLEIAIAPWAGCGMPSGANQSATGTTTQTTEKISRHEAETRPGFAAAGIVAVMSVALMGTSL